jgi:von Willebrand factor type A domain
MRPPTVLRCGLAALFLAVAVGSLRGSPWPARSDEHAAVVTVFAEKGTPIRDLTAKDFVVKEGGKKLDVVEARLSTDPLSVALLLDTAQPPRGMAAPTRELRTAPAAFAKVVLETNPDAKIALWQFANSPTLEVDFTSKADDLSGVLARLYSRPEAGSALVEALEAAAKPLASRPGSRRALVSVDFNSPEASPESVLQRTADAIAYSGASLWVVSVRGNTMPSSIREQLVQTMTKSTGGRLILTIEPSGLEDALVKVAASLTSQYLVTFTRTGDGAMKRPTFETVRGPKVLATPFIR